MPINWSNFEAIGAGLCHHNELEEQIYRQAAIFVDHLESANKELIGLLNGGIRFFGEIGQVITGELEAVDTNVVTVFQSLGELLGKREI